MRKPIWKFNDKAIHKDEFLTDGRLMLSIQEAKQLRLKFSDEKCSGLLAIGKSFYSSAGIVDSENITINVKQLFPANTGGFQPFMATLFQIKEHGELPATVVLHGSCEGDCFKFIRARYSKIIEYLGLRMFGDSRNHNTPIVLRNKYDETIGLVMPIKISTENFGFVISGT